MDKIVHHIIYSFNAMILLLSQKFDYSTEQISRWLVSLGKTFLRIDKNHGHYTLEKIDLQNREIIFSGPSIRFNCYDVRSIFIRKSGLDLKNIQPYNQASDIGIVFPEQPDYHTKHLAEECNDLLGFIYDVLENNPIKIIGTYKHRKLNKLHILLLAKNVGLKIPNTYVIHNRMDLENCLNQQNGKLVSKALSDGVYLFTENYGFYSYTERLTIDIIKKKLDQTFFPSLIQEEIEKDFELRVFLLDNTFYAMAIFSQTDSSTQVDYRKQSIAERKSRMVPFILPKIIEKKLMKVFNQAGLNTGSADLMVDKRGNYFFLEINPSGQFSMTSTPCNYYLEKRIADKL